MAGPIYHWFRVRPTEAWYQLTKAEQDSVLQKEQAIAEQVGCKTVMICRSRWATEQWHAFGVNEYPNMESLQKHDELAEAIGWVRYFHAETMLGVPFEQ